MVPVLAFISGLWVHSWVTVPSFLSFVPFSRGFGAIRLGCHHLRNTGRWVHPPVVRRRGFFSRCHSTCLDNEAHCLLVCSHPTIVDSREKMHAAIPAAFLHNVATYAHFWNTLGRLLSPDMVVATVKLVAVCTRVAWFTHKSGASLAHGLPEALVNTDAHLDLF
jgi:hypothetical protein